MGGRRPISSTTTLVLVLSFFFLIALSHVAEGYNNLRLKDCPKKCKGRCKATSHKKPCMLYCQKCCAKCRCVPAGVYGNKQTCPCYNNWKTQEGKPKCP